VIVVTRLRSGDDLAAPLVAAATALKTCPGCAGVEVGRNLDEPELWVLESRWTDVGSYRRALSSYDVKLALAPVMHAFIDEPSAYETRAVETGDVWNRNIPR